MRRTIWRSVGRICIGIGHALLKIDRTLHRVDGAGELDEHAISRDLEDATLMLGDQRLQNVLTSSFESSQRAGLIALHKPAIANHIGGQDGGSRR